MKTFKQLRTLINEVWADDKVGKGDMKTHYGFQKEKFDENRDRYHHIGTLATGHKVWHRRMKAEAFNHIYVNNRYIVTHPKDDNRVSMALDTSEPEWADNDKRKSRPKTEQIGGLSKDVIDPDNTVKAKHLYHHLITKHNKIFMSDHQSPGGRAVWRDTMKMPGVDGHVQHGLDDDPKAKPINAKVTDEEGDEDHETYGVHHDIEKNRYVSKADTEYLKAVHPDTTGIDKRVLVMYPKVKSKGDQ